MAKRSRLPDLVRTVTRDVIDHPRDLTRHYSKQLSISRVSANKYIQKLEEQGWIARSGPSTHPVFSLGYNRRLQGLYELRGLEEHAIWESDFRPYLSLSPNLQTIAAHGFTEMINNSIDHSGGNDVFVFVTQSAEVLRIITSDDGVGIFLKISEALALPDMRQALFELSKGKLTTDPSRHSGEGVFFTSRMFDAFEIEANGLKYNHTDEDQYDWVAERDNVFQGGTAVFMSIALDSKRTTAGVYAQFTDAPEDYDFSKTIVPMRLANYGEEQLVSRSQAKRLIARFDRFKSVILDFNAVSEIGQAFADELFRVYRLSNPAVDLTPTNMNPQVERMWLRATSPRTGLLELAPKKSKS